MKTGDFLKNQNLKVNFKLPEIDLTHTRLNLAAIDEMVEEMNRDREEKEAKEEAYKTEQLRLLRDIAENTKGLDTVVSLLAHLSNQQDEVLNLLKECLAIGTATSKQEAESKYRQVMGKITTVVEDVSTIQTLCGFANTVYTMSTNLLG